MKISELDILVLPGLTGGTDVHWYRRWAAKLSTAKVVEQENWDVPEKTAWVSKIVEAVDASIRPVFLISHSMGTLTAVHAAHEPKLAGKIKGAFLVAVPDPEIVGNMHTDVSDFAPLPSAPLPFPSLMVASRNDPYCSFEKAEGLALDWGALFIDGGEHGHFNPDSGHGPWPEGLMALSKFLNQLN